jgi:mono/diheme cytochrome c family protein
MTKLRVVTIATWAAALICALVVGAVSARPKPQAFDATAFYKGKCVMCHGKKAEKKFDSSLTDEQLVEIVLKGKKVAKPPHMPAYSEKGVSEEQAKALVALMKQLKATP